MPAKLYSQLRPLINCELPQSVSSPPRASAPSTVTAQPRTSAVAGADPRRPTQLRCHALSVVVLAEDHPSTHSGGGFRGGSFGGGGGFHGGGGGGGHGGGRR